MKRQNIILAGVVLFFLLLASFLLPTDQSMDAASGAESAPPASVSQKEDVSGASASASDESSAEDWLPAGSYTVGDSLPAGSYVLRQLPDKAVGYVRVTKGKKALLEQNFEQCLFLSLEDGQGISFSGASLRSAEGFQQKVNLEQLDPGMYRVGVDIPVGSYEIAESEDQPMCSYAVYPSDSVKRKAREQNYVMGSITVEVSNGELLDLIGCSAQKQ